MAPGPKSKKEASANALAAFHHVVAKGQIERVKDFVVVRTPTFSLHARLPLPRRNGAQQGAERRPEQQRVPVNSQDNDGLAAVHWAAMRGTA